MKKALAVLMLVTSTAHAQWNFDNSGGREFDMSKNMTNKSTITIKYVEANKINQACNEESRKVGNNGYNYKVLACSFYWDNRCTIIVPKKVDMRTIGHEVMHCFQGDWHAGKTE